jgi:hypothetical protein
MQNVKFQRPMRGECGEVEVRVRELCHRSHATGREILQQLLRLYILWYMPNPQDVTLTPSVVVLSPS